MSNPVVLERMEQELASIQDSINELKARQKDLSKEKPVDFACIRQKLKVMAEHFDKLLLYQSNPIEKARLFGLLFKKLPSYVDLQSGTPQNQNSSLLTPVFEAISSNVSSLVTLRGIEPRFPD